jgi:hypothetical protein
MYNNPIGFDLDSKIKIQKLLNTSFADADLIFKFHIGGDYMI